MVSVVVGALLMMGTTAWAQTEATRDAPVSVAQAPAPATPAPAAAPAAESKGPNTGRINLTLGADWTSAYFFRGIRQETDGFILQPYGEIAFKLVESAGPMANLVFSLGSWNSLHTGGNTGPGCEACSDPKMWYESDFIVKLGATFFEDLTVGLVYTAYMSPNDLFGTVQELGLSVAYNDSKLLGAFALNPSLLFAGEIKGQADAGSKQGIYLQLGVSPGYTFFSEATYPLSLSFPVILGLSVRDYYEFGGSDNPVFGYVQWGPALSVPLAFIPTALGKWQIKAGVSFLNLGETLKKVNNGDAFQVLGTVGIALTY
jgi:hypothetical protein